MLIQFTAKAVILAGGEDDMDVLVQQFLQAVRLIVGAGFAIRTPGEWHEGICVRALRWPL